MSRGFGIKGEWGWAVAIYGCLGSGVKGVRGEGYSSGVKDLGHLEIILDPLMEVPSIAKNNTIFYGTNNINCYFHNT